MTQAAGQSGSPFLQGYVRLMADSANLRAVIRARRKDKGPDFLGQALLPGGNVSPDRLRAAKAEELPALFHGHLAEAAAAGVSAGKDRALWRSPLVKWVPKV